MLNGSEFEGVLDREDTAAGLQSEEGKKGAAETLWGLGFRVWGLGGFGGVGFRVPKQFLQSPNHRTLPTKHEQLETSVILAPRPGRDRAPRPKKDEFALGFPVAYVHWLRVWGLVSFTMAI